MTWSLYVVMVILGLMEGGCCQNASASLANGWHSKRDNNWYLFVKDPLPWQEASDDCNNQGGHLVEIGSANEQTYLDVMLRQVPEGLGHWWIGLSDQFREGSFVWESSGRPGFFQNWHPWQPDNHGEDESCVELVDGRWNDADCEQHYRYICEL